MYTLLKAIAEKFGVFFTQKKLSVSIKSRKFQNVTGDNNLLCVTPEAILSLMTDNSVSRTMTAPAPADLEHR